VACGRFSLRRSSVATVRSHRLDDARRANGDAHTLRTRDRRGVSRRASCRRSCAREGLLWQRPSVDALVIVPSEVDADMLVVVIRLFVPRDYDTAPGVQLLHACGKPPADERLKLDAGADASHKHGERAEAIAARQRPDLDVPDNMQPPGS
jgi:hypothetical protein